MEGICPIDSQFSHEISALLKPPPAHQLQVLILFCLFPQKNVGEMEGIRFFIIIVQQFSICSTQVSLMQLFLSFELGFSYCFNLGEVKNSKGFLLFSFAFFATKQRGYWLAKWVFLFLFTNPHLCFYWLCWKLLILFIYVFFNFWI